MNLTELYILPLIKTLIDRYLSQFTLDEYAARANPLYNFYEWIYQNRGKL